MSDIKHEAQAAGIRNCWILTDGKAGDELKCLGIAQELGLEPETRCVSPRPPWSWMMPYGPIDPRDKSENRSSPIGGKWPDLVIASGRRAVAYVRQIRRETDDDCFTVILMDPRTGSDAAHMIWVPEHDWLRADNVMVTLTSPHVMSDVRLNAARMTSNPLLAGYTKPYIGVLLGGDSRAFAFDEQSERELAFLLGEVASTMPDGGTLLITPSRRTSASTISVIREVLRKRKYYLWDGSGENPYLTILANSDQLIVTADSVNMIGEAVSTGSPVHIFRPKGGHHKIDYFLSELEKLGAIKALDPPLQPFDYEPLNATPLIAREIVRRYKIWAAETRKPDTKPAPVTPP